MSQYGFGTGQVFGVRTDIANAQPIQLGVLQDISVDFDATVKSLVGQSQFAVALARGEIKVSGKAKFARISAASYNNLFFGQTEGTVGSGPQNLVPASPGEAVTVPAPSGPYTVQVAQHSNYVADLGVFVAATGKQLVPVASSSEVANVSYSVNVSTGTYTFAAGDASVAMYISYQYTAATGTKITLNNLIMGSTPTFSLKLFEAFPVLGTAKQATLILNNVTSKKLALPFKNQDWMINELDFEACADAAGVLGTFDMTDA